MTLIITLPWASYRPGGSEQRHPSSSLRPRAVAVDCSALRRANTRHA